MLPRRKDDQGGADGPCLEYDDEQFVVHDFQPRREHIAALTAELRRAGVCVLPGVAQPYELANVPEPETLDGAYAVWVSMSQVANQTGGAMALYVPAFAIVLRHMALMAAGHGPDEVRLREGALADIGYEVLLQVGPFPQVRVTIFPRRTGAVPHINVDAMLRAGNDSRDVIATALAHHATPDTEILRVAAGIKN